MRTFYSIRKGELDYVAWIDYAVIEGVLDVLAVGAACDNRGEGDILSSS